MAERGHVSHPGRRVQEADRGHHEESLKRLVASVESEGKRLGAGAPPNTVIVQPGGRPFTSITAAINSITDAGPTNLYMVNVGAGTWEERIVMMPWIIVAGTLDPATDEPLTIVQKAGGRASGDWGTVIAASNSSIQALQVRAYATAAGVNIYAVNCFGAAPFAIGNCRLTGDNMGFDVAEFATIAVDFHSTPPSPSSVSVNYTQAAATATGTSDYPVALAVGGSAHADLMECGLVAHGRDHSTGGAGFDHSVTTLTLCKVTGDTYSLLLWTRGAQMTARHCTLTGEVDPAVKVIP